MEKLTMKQLSEELELVKNDLLILKAQLEQLQESSVKRNAPKSERNMVEIDAYRILVGDLKDASHKEAAKVLSLSYGQIYSCRKEFTFKSVHYEIAKAEKNGVEVVIPLAEPPAEIDLSDIDLPDYDPDANQFDDVDDDDLPEFIIPEELKA